MKNINNLDEIIINENFYLLILINLYGPNINKTVLSEKSPP